MKKTATSSILETIASPYTAYVGIDWADRKHDICLYDPNTQQFEFSVIGSQPEAIATWAEELRKRFNTGAIAPLHSIIYRFTACAIVPNASSHHATHSS